MFQTLFPSRGNILSNIFLGAFHGGNICESVPHMWWNERNSVTLVNHYQSLPIIWKNNFKIILFHLQQRFPHSRCYNQIFQQ